MLNIPWIYQRLCNSMSTEIDIPSHQFSFLSLACHAFSYTILYPNENWWEPLSISVDTLKCQTVVVYLSCFSLARRLFSLEYHLTYKFIYALQTQVLFLFFLRCIRCCIRQSKKETSPKEPTLLLQEAIFQLIREAHTKTYFSIKGNSILCISNCIIHF